MILSNQCTPPGHSPWLSFYDLNLQKTFFSLVAQAVKNPPAMWETQVQSLGWENLLEKGMTTHASILDSPEGCRVGHNWATNTFPFPWSIQSSPLEMVLILNFFAKSVSENASLVLFPVTTASSIKPPGARRPVNTSVSPSMTARP